MWSFPTLCVYDWSEWRDFVIQSAWSRAKRIAANFGETPDEIAARLPESARILLLHLDISDSSPFVADGSALLETLARREVRVLNALAPDIRKRTIERCCRDFGLESVAASKDGPYDELLIVKTDLNSGGERERLLTDAQRRKFGLVPHSGRVKGPADYFVARRAEMPKDIWNDPTLVVQRYVKNRSNRFYRVYVVMNAVVVSEAYSDKPVKRVGGLMERYNYFLWRRDEIIFGDPNIMAQVPRDLLRDAGMFLNRFKLDYGAIDVVESENGKFYVVDANKTPHWGDEVQPGLIEHLRRGFDEAMSFPELSVSR